MTKYYKSVKIALEGMKPENIKQSFQMFQYFSMRLLLGEESENINNRLDQLIADYKKTDRLNIDLVEMTYFAALKELNGESGKEAARKGLSFLETAGEIDEQNYQIVESALALAVLTGNEKLKRRFFNAGLKLYDNKKTLTFELLFLALFESPDDKTLQRLADITARAIRVSIWSLPIYSAATHVCVLSALAEKSKNEVGDLLKNRLKSLDDIVFDDDAPKLNFNEPAYRLENSDDDEFVLTARQRITGKGALNTGIYELKEFTSELPQTVRTAAEEGKIRQTKAKHNRDVLIKKSLESENGEFRAVLDLAKDVEFSSLDRELLQKRFDLGWQITKAVNDKVKCGSSLEITTPKE